MAIERKHTAASTSRPTRIGMAALIVVALTAGAVLGGCGTSWRTTTGYVLSILPRSSSETSSSI
jgi:hypothetical protein